PRRLTRQLDLHDDVVVPLAEVLGAGSYLLGLGHYWKTPFRTFVNATLRCFPVFKSRTTATFALRSSGPMITAREAPRAAASSSCLRIGCFRSAYSTAIPRSRSPAASCSTVATPSPPTATNKPYSSPD